MKKVLPRKAVRNLGSRPKVFSYYRQTVSDDLSANERAGANRGETMRAHERLARLAIGFPTVLAIVVIVLSIMFSLTLKSTPRIIVASGQPLYDAKVYQEGVEKAIKNSFLNKLKLSFQEEKLVSDIREQFPEVQGATVALPLLNRSPIVGLEFSKPAFLMVANNSTFIVDSSGVVVAESKNVQSSATDGLMRVQDLFNAEISVGSRLASPETIAFMQEISRQLSAKSIAIDKIIVPATVNELYIYPKDTKYFIKVTSQTSAAQQIGAYDVTIQRLTAENKLPNEYIDVRLGDRVFVK